MTDPSDLEARVAALESRVEEVAADASAARHLAAAGDRDLSELGVKVDAHRAAINALGVQTAARFAEVDRRFEQVDRRFEQIDRRFEQVDLRFDRLEDEMRTGFAEMRFKFDQTAAGLERIVGLVTTLMQQRGDDR